VDAGQAQTPEGVPAPVRPLLPARRPAFPLLRWCAGIGWLAWFLSIGLLWGQHRAGVMHPAALPFALLLTLTVLATLLGAGVGQWPVVRGPRRRVAAAWGLVCFVPLGFWAGLAAYTLRQAATGQSLPRSTFSDLALIGVASLMEGQAHLAYPHRLESQRLVMFYDDRVTDPHKDLEAMDQHVAALEAETGMPLRARIHWVRGEVFGRRPFAIRGLVLGSSHSPADWDTADHPFHLSVDRHELAHGVIHQLQPTDADPPTLLIEGWAETHSGLVVQKQAEFALQSRKLWRERAEVGQGSSYLRELTGEAWYRRVDGAVYSVGAPFAGYILKKYGTERFLRLYFACRPGQFAEVCRAELGIDLDALESEFWAEVERLAGDISPSQRK
jgi:hypothetical protein